MTSVRPKGPPTTKELDKALFAVGAGLALFFILTSFVQTAFSADVQPMNAESITR